MIKIMKNAILLHGLPSKDEYYNDQYPSASNSHWFPWLQKHLMVHGIKADTPEIFHVYDALYEEWVKEVERFDITPTTSLVGHSMGSGFWIRYLSEHPDLAVDKVILVAPWLNIDHERDITFFDFEIDSTITGRTKKLVIFYSDNDSQGVKLTVELLQRRFPDAEFRLFPGYGHFTLKRMKTDAFPELLDTLL